MKFTYAPDSRPLEGFTIKRAVHRGHFGEVYFALSDGGKEVALKLLRQDVDVELRGVTQCLNLKHPHLVTLFDVRQDGDGDYWIIMEFVSGQRLDQFIDDYPRGMPMEKVLTWLNGIADGLTFMHNSGIVHRDLKPANLFWDHGQVKIGDVGLSKIISPGKKSAQTQSVGTVYYMAPEVAHGRYGRTVDVYSLGVILVEMLTGHLPFDGETVAEILFKHLTGEPDLSMVPEPVKPVLARALEKDPEKRIASVQQLRDEFVQAVRTGKSPVPPVVAEPPRASEPPRIDTTDRRETRSPSPADNPAYARELERRVERERHRHEKHASRHDRPAIGPLLAIPIIFFGVLFLMGSIRFVGVTNPVWLIVVIFFFVLPMIFLFVLGGTFKLFKGLLGLNSDLDDARANRERYAPPPQSTSSSRASTSSRGGVDESHVHTASRHAVKPVNVKAAMPLSPHLQPLSVRVQQYAWEMILSVIFTSILTAGLVVVSSQFGVSVPFHDRLHNSQGELLKISSEWDPAMVAFFAAVTVLSVWGILLPVRVGERRQWDGGTCRLVSGLFGILVGTSAYLLDRWLLLPLTLPKEGHFGMVGIFDHLGRQALLDANREPTWFGYSLFFFLLFSLARWWKQSMAYRKKRLSMFAIFATLFISFIITIFWAFPMNWGLTWAMVISSVVQLSSLNYGHPLPRK